MSTETAGGGNCPKCGAAKAFPEIYECRSEMPHGEEFWQSDRCRRLELENAIRTHRSQKSDDRCIEDDDRLYEALGDGIKCDRRVGDQSAMLENCKRFIANRTEGGGWPTYTSLELHRDKLREACEAALRWIERDETAHGRQFGCGNELRAALALTAPASDTGDTADQQG